MKYFNDNISSLEELKKEYKRLVKQFHPDLNLDRDTTEDMKAINAEYKKLFASLNSGLSPELPEEFVDVLNNIINIDGLEIEICGAWVWVSGNTFGNKDALKMAGFRWASKKKMWYWHPADMHCKSSGKDIEAIREKYGSQKIAGKHRIELGA